MAQIDAEFYIGGIAKLSVYICEICGRKNKAL